MGIFSKGINKAAYQGNLNCPHLVDAEGKRSPWGDKTCGSSAIRHVEDITPWLIRYRCRKCGGKFQYDISAFAKNPYAPYRKGKIWRNIEYVLQGRSLKGVVQ